jgi:hypothetical protein
MIHFVHDRPLNALKIFDTSPGSASTSYEAGSDAWGNYGASDDDQPAQPPWGHSCRIPPGHYVLQNATTFATPISSEGSGQIEIVDIPLDTMAQLTTSGLAVLIGTAATIGPITLPLNQLAQYSRTSLLIHGGGSNLGSHFNDPNQRLLRTFGCVRVHNKDLPALIALVQARGKAEIIVYSAYSTPAPLPGY